MARRSIFTVGGTVQAGGGRYLPRHVDDDLLALCREGDFGFVLTARQMGKSSLMVHTAERLAREGIRSVIIDLSQIGVQVTPDAWHLGLLITIEEALDLDTDVYQWWEAHAHLGYGQRLTRFFEEVLLAEVDEPVVVFIDEIDTTLSLDFTDDFFAAIRYVYNARSTVPAFNRLSFVLIGVATPSDLISDPKRTPFNIGRRVEADYFTVDEAMPLAEGFDLQPEDARQALGWILEWTAGHPYLTQRLCAVIAKQHPSRVTKGDVDAAVAVAFLGNKSEQDSNLRFVHDMLTQRAVDPLAVLATYRQILQGQRVQDDRQSAPVTHLKLAGIVGRQNGHLGVRNPIYATVFNRAWVKEQWPEHWFKSIPPAVKGLAAAVFVGVVLFGLLFFQVREAKQAQEASNAQLVELNKQLVDQVQVSDSLNTTLTAQIRVSDSLRIVSEEANTTLIDQIRVSDSLRLVAEDRLREVQAARLEVITVDSLRAVERDYNVQLTDQIRVSDSLRTIAEERLDEVQQARLETNTIALASKALRQLKLGDAELGALLARQAFLFSRQGEGEFLDPIYDALRQTLNALDAGGSGTTGGPEVMDDYAAGVRDVAYSPDGRWIAVGGDDGALWLLPNGSAVPGAGKRLLGHTAGIRALAFSPDGSRLVSGSDDQTIQVWQNLDQAQPGRQTIGRHQGGVWAVAFSPDGAYVVSAGEDRTVMVWDLDAGRGLPLRPQGDVRVRALEFSPDGSRLAVGGEDGTLELWPWPSDGGLPITWDSGQGRLRALAFSPAGDLLASGGDLPEVHLWRLGQPGAAPDTLRGHEGPINALAFSPAGDLLASGSSDHSAQVWDVDRLDRSPIILQDHTAWVWSLAFSPDGSRLASGSADRSLRIWNVKPERLAEQICNTVQGELGPDAWSRFVGEDFPYEQDYIPCSRTVNR